MASEKVVQLKTLAQEDKGRMLQVLDDARAGVEAGEITGLLLASTRGGQLRREEDRFNMSVSFPGLLPCEAHFLAGVAALEVINVTTTPPDFDMEDPDA